jgi:hypothetical protein
MVCDTMALLNRDEILGKDDRTYEVVEVPEWGGPVRLRSLTGRERDSFEATLQEQRGGKTKQNFDNFRARLVGMCAVDEEGKLLFANRADIVMLGNKSVAALQRLFNKCNEMNGLSEQDVEELTEGFGAAADEGSISD